MKIRALRVREVGRLDAPVAVEGFSGGLDLLAGPNEMGKSTLFRALRIVLGAKHNSKSKDVERLTPYVGGQPLVEADFELGGETWRITKRFGKGPRAQLMRLDNGSIVARNSEADELLAEMLDQNASGFAAHGLVWVGQKESLQAPQPDARSERGALMAAIEAEVGTVAGSGIADDVRASVLQQLGELVTTRGAKKGGRYAAALDRRAELEKQLALEKAALDAVASSQAELDGLQARLGEVADGSQLAALEAKAKAASEALGEAERQRLRIRQANEAVQFCSNEQKTAHAALEDFHAKIARLAELSEGDGGDEAQLAELRQAAEDAQSAYDKFRADGERMRDEERRLQSVGSRLEIVGRLKAKSRVLEKVQQLDEEIADATEHMRSDPITSERIDRLQRVDNQQQLAEGRIAAESPTVKIRYEADTRERVFCAGQALDDGVDLHVRQPLVLDIPGVGSIAISPGHGEGREELIKRAEELSAERDGLLQELGADDVAAALELFSARQKRDRRLASAIAELRGLAPDGAASLRADVADLENQLGQLAAGDDSEPGELGDLSSEEVARRLQSMAQELDAARRAYPECAALQKATAAALAEAQTAVAARRQRIEELERLLGSHDNREAVAAKLEADARAADEKLAASVRTLTALQDVLPDADALAELNARAGDAAKTLEQARLESGRLREAMSAARARIEMAGDAGLGRRVGELEGELERATAQVAHFEAEVDSLNLLLEAMDEARDKARDRLLAPLQERVGPYLSSVFGSARARFAEGFALDGLQRDGREPEAIDRLSDGTQEQLGLIARLAYARLIADRGEALPVILDDPLVYSDAERIEQMFGALRDASAVHQVVVLTCREEAFAALGGKRLELTSWRPAGDL